MTADWLEINVDASSMRALRVLPAAGGSDSAALHNADVPGVLVCMHAPGIDAFMEDVARRLAIAGYAAIVPDLYHRQAANNGDSPLLRMGRLRDAELFRDLAAATAALRMSPGVAARRIAVIGFCMGGRIAWLQAARDATLNAACCFYPGAIDTAWGGGEEKSRGGAEEKSWGGPEEKSWGGEALTPLQWGEKIAVPVLGLFGAEDTNPSSDHRQAMTRTLMRAGVTHDMRVYPGCGHAFLNFQRPSFRPEAAADAWQRCLDWLGTHNQPD